MSDADMQTPTIVVPPPPVVQGTDLAKQAALYGAIAAATARAKSIGKDSVNTHHEYKYASAEAVIEEARAPLAAEGVCVIQAWTVEWCREPGDYFADVVCTYTVAHKDGGWMLITVPFPAIRGKGRPEDKAIAASLTYSLGYFLRGLIMLPRVDAANTPEARDDNGYEPSNRGQRQRSGDNWHGRGEQRDGQRTPQGSGKAEKPPAAKQEPDVPAFDTNKTIERLRELGELGDTDGLRKIAEEVNARAPKADKPRLSAEYSNCKTKALEVQAQRQSTAGAAA